MNYTETFSDFAAKVTTLDLALYAGVGLVLWVLFKDRLSPVQKLILDITNKFTSKSGLEKLPPHPDVSVPSKISETKKEDVFFKLVASWKQTRDLAVQSDCLEAVKVADQMFPFLSPNGCQPKTPETK
jgi:hypothetical protein